MVNTYLRYNTYFIRYTTYRVYNNINNYDCVYMHAWCALVRMCCSTSTNNSTKPYPLLIRVSFISHFLD